MGTRFGTSARPSLMQECRFNNRRSVLLLRTRSSSTDAGVMQTARGDSSKERASFLPSFSITRFCCFFRENETASRLPETKWEGCSVAAA